MDFETGNSSRKPSSALAILFICGQYLDRVPELRLYGCSQIQSNLALVSFFANVLYLKHPPSVKSEGTQPPWSSVMWAILVSANPSQLGGQAGDRFCSPSEFLGISLGIYESLSTLGLVEQRDILITWPLRLNRKVRAF